MLSRYHGAHDATAAIREARTELDVFEAATLGDADTLHDLLHEDPSLVDARSPDDATALHFAAFFAQPETASLLVDHGADVHTVSTTFGNVTPLHSAAAGGSAEIVHLVLAAGADANARQNGGFTALHAAAQNGDAAMTRDLLDHGAEVDPRPRTAAPRLRSRRSRATTRSQPCSASEPRSPRRACRARPPSPRRSSSGLRASPSRGARARRGSRRRQRRTAPRAPSRVASG